MQEPSQHESQAYDQQQSQDSGNEQLLKSQIVHSDNTLQKLLADTTSFFNKIKQYNDLAVNLIQQRDNRQALIYLQQAERMLEYGAVRGKTIDRNLILCVLNNEAVGYQKEWIMQKAAKYIQALIYNIELSIEQDNISIELLYNFDTEKEQNKLMCLTLIKRKNMLIKYYLIYCALMSQLKQNNLALQNSFKALNALKQLFQGYSNYYKINTFREKEQRIYTAQKLRLLKQLSNYNEYLQNHNYQTLFKRTQYMLKEWKQLVDETKLEEKLQNQIKDFSITNVMQPGALTYQDFNKKADLIEEISMLSLLKKVLLFTINFFSIATEMRLIDIHKHSTYQEKMKSAEFRKSELYHLTAIKIFCTYVPCDSVLVKHIRISYSNHYKRELNVTEIEYVDDDQFINQKKEKESQKEKKSLIDSEKYVISYSVAQQYEEDMIKPVEKVAKKKKYVPMIEIPKSPKPSNTSKTKMSGSKKKTPRMMMTSPPIPSTTRKRKEIGTLVSPKPISTKRNSSVTKIVSKHHKQIEKEKQEKYRQTSRNKKKSRISKDKSQLKRDKDKSETKIKKKSKSQNKMKSSKYSTYSQAVKYKTNY